MRPVLRVDAPGNVRLGATVYDSSSVFQYALNVVMDPHDDSENLYNLLNAMFGTAKYLADRFGIYDVRMLVNSNYNKRYGGKEHQHGWIVMNTPQAMKIFDEEIRVCPFSAVKGEISKTPWKDDNKTTMTIDQVLTDDSMINNINKYGSFEGRRLQAGDNFYVYVYLTRDKTWSVISFVN
jgi:hypothetical protein